VKYLCQWFGVSRSGFYDWLNRGESSRLLSDGKLLRQIEDIFIASNETYGSPRVFQALRHRNVYVSRKRVERLMRDNGMRARLVKVTKRNPSGRRFMVRHDNLRVDLDAPDGPDQVWVADVTYLKAGAKRCYLATVMDLWSRRIIAWSLDTHRTVDLTLGVLKKAIARRGSCDNLIFHSDRGMEYISYRHTDELKRHGIQISVNRPGRCTDNAHMESFFHSMKTELIRGRKYKTLKALKKALISYISRFYNHRRLHSGIGYLSPVAFEANAV